MHSPVRSETDFFKGWWCSAWPVRSSLSSRS